MLKQHYVEIGYLCDLVTQQSATTLLYKYISQVSNNLSEVTVLTTNKIHYIITICVKNVYLEVKMYVTL